MARGDERVFAPVQDLIRRMTHSLSYELRVDADARDDVVQEVSLKVFRNWRQFNGRSKLSTWIYSIARNQCLDALAQQTRHRPPSSPTKCSPEDPQSDDPDDSQSNLEQRRCVQAMLAELEREPEARDGSVRKIVLLRYWVENGATSEELAAFLKTSIQAAKQRKHYVLEQVRALCRKHCGTDECGLAPMGAA